MGNIFLAGTWKFLLMTGLSLIFSTSTSWAGTPIVTDFSTETVGAMPTTFAAAVGNWSIGIDDGNKVLLVDGRKWSRGQASTGLADKARALYGDRYAEFLDNVQAYAYFPFAVDQQVDNFTNGKITMRFKAIAGRIDQGAGILFDLKPNGDYYAKVYDYSETDYRKRWKIYPFRVTMGREPQKLKVNLGKLYADGKEMSNSDITKFGAEKSTATDDKAKEKNFFESLNPESLINTFN